MSRTFYIVANTCQHLRLSPLAPRLLKCHFKGGTFYITWGSLLGLSSKLITCLMLGIMLTF
jgi:hypothetical protein